MQIFEILRPYGAPIMKFIYEDPLGVPIWHVVGSGVAPQTYTATVGSRSVEWTYTGAALTNPERTINIPIVQFNKNAHIPNTIRGVRVLYMDKAFGPAYFSKKIAVKGKAVAAAVAAAVAEPGPGPCIDTMAAAEPGPCVDTMAAAEPGPCPINYVHPQQRQWVPEADDDDVKKKGITMLSMFVLFVFVSMYSNYMDRQMKNKMDPFDEGVCYENPWKDPFVNAYSFHIRMNMETLLPISDEKDGAPLR
jgi:hypothetical protein